MACPCAGQMAFGIGPDQAGHSNRGDAKGQGQAVTQKFCPQVGGDFAMQDTGHHADAVQPGAVARFGGLVSGAAVQIFPDKFRDAPLRAGAQVGQGGISGM